MDSKPKHVFFLGIGGIGMSALARYFHQSGHKVSGYDRDNSALTKKLEALGIKIQYDFDERLLDHPIDIVIYTPAIKGSQYEFQYFKDRNIRMLKRSEALEEILIDKKVIAVAGTHGKTTTSALLAHILYYNNFGATAFVGGVMSNYKTNFIYGNGPWVIVEADEYDRSFWRLYPQIAVIQAMDADHLDIYGTEGEMIDAYRVFSLQIAEDGKLFLSKKTEGKLHWEWKDTLERKGIEIRTFGIEQGDLRVYNLLEEEGESHFSLGDGGIRINLSLAGAHNVQNALGAIAVARSLGIVDEKIAKAISSFTGIERRFQYVYRSDECVIIDDYAHHPKEIDAAISAAQQHHPGRKLTVVFQPHLYSRTRDFMKDFAVSLSNADEVILVELYPAREQPLAGISSQRLLLEIELEEKAYVPKKDLVNYLVSEKRELILLLGAGDVHPLINKLIEEYRK